MERDISRKVPQNSEEEAARPQKQKVRKVLRGVDGHLVVSHLVHPILFLADCSHELGLLWVIDSGSITCLLDIEDV